MRFSEPRLKRARPLLGTFVTIELAGPVREEALHRWISEGFEAISEVDRWMSCHRPGSDLTHLNEAAQGRWLSVHPLTADVLRASNELFDKSGGAFDIRCGAVLARRGIIPLPRRSGPRRVPRDGRTPVEVRGTRVRKTGPWVMDLGGIAKGYAVDCAVRRIRLAAANKRLSGMVNAGGDLRVWGRRSARLSALIGGNGSLWARTFRLREAAAATSSIRAGFAAFRGSRAAHIRMPQATVLSQPATVTVIAEDCLHADALTKVALTARPDLADACLSRYRARAMAFDSQGRLRRFLG